MTFHSRRSPSGADRWMVCGQSVQGLPDMPRTSNFAAAQGTAAHEVWEDCLNDDLFDPHDFVGQARKVDGHEIEITAEMAEHLMAGVEKVRELPGVRFVERRVRLDRWAPGESGLLDTCVIDGKQGWIIDLKYGYGEVDPELARQLKLYALGAIDTIPGADEVQDWCMAIFQPRNGGWKDHWITKDDLLAFGDEVVEAIKRTEDPFTPYVPGEKQCQYCPKLDTPEGCAANEQWKIDLCGFSAETDLDGDQEPLMLDAKRLTPARKAYLVLNRGVVSKWLNELAAQALADAVSGEPWPGLKAVQGEQGDRKWKDEKAVEALLVRDLKDEAYTKKILSPAQSEKILVPTKKRPGNSKLWSDLQALIDRAPGGPKLVPADDPRPPYTWTPEQLFPD